MQFTGVSNNVIAANILAAGVQIVDQPVVFQAGFDTGVVAPLVTFLMQPSAATLFDTSKQQSVHIRINVTSAHAAAIAPTDYVLVEVYWGFDSTTGLYSQTDFIGIYPNQQVVDVWVPARGTNITVNAINNSTANFRATVDIIGSQRVIPKTRISGTRNGGAPGVWNAGADVSMGVVTATGVPVPAGLGGVIAIPVAAGNLQVVVAPDAVVTAAGVLDLLAHDGRVLATMKMPVGATTSDSIITMTCQQGFAPVYLFQVTKPTGPANYNIAATWRD